jgi:hypothetical protein
MAKRTKPMTQLKIGFPDPMREKIKKLARERDESEAVIIRELVRDSLSKAA